MKKYLLSLGLALVLLNPAHAHAQTENCRVVGVSDGDTLTCLTPAKKSLKVRLAQIDAPESRQSFGTASKENLSRLVFGKDVTLNIQETDRYGRHVAEVFSGSLNANKEQVKNGFAWAYREYLKDQSYIALENEARQAKRGLWREANPIKPSDFRKGVKNGTYQQPSASSDTQTRSPFQRQQSGSLTCGTKNTCKQMTSCQEAKHYLNVCGVKSLDGNKDGVPCESLCK